jgi:tRNA (guanine9-N1)-methyltransferase
LISICPTVVYLTADSDNVLWDLAPGTAYIIGAFVDHNQQKGLTKSFADGAGITTARLPIQETVKSKTICKVLTINHVVQSLVEYYKCRSWEQAFATALPTRRVQDVDAASGAQRSDDSDDEEGVDGE